MYTVHHSKWMIGCGWMLCDSRSIDLKGMRSSPSSEDDIALATRRVVHLHRGLSRGGLLLLGGFLGLLLDGGLVGLERDLLGSVLLGLGLGGVVLGRLVPSEGEVALASGRVVDLDGSGSL